MLFVAAILCGILSLAAGAVGFTGVLKGLAGAAKAAFFGFLAIGAVLGGVALLTAHRLKQ